MSITEDSLKSTHKKSIGGLLSSIIPGVFIHTNTIEEYQAMKITEVNISECSGVLDVDNLKEFNKFIVVAFGDLKNYLYHHR